MASSRCARHASGSWPIWAGRKRSVVSWAALMRCCCRWSRPLGATSWWSWPESLCRRPRDPHIRRACQKGTILVTGGAGFIGSHVCDALIAEGLAVRCFDNLATGKRGNISHLEAGPDFSFVEGDLRSLDDLKSAVTGSSAIVHLGALGSVPRSIADPLPSEAANLAGFLNLLEAARHAGVKRIVYASSSSVYGDSAELPKREGTEGRPLSPYAVTKAMDEAYANLYHHMHGLELVRPALFNVFGERQELRKDPTPRPYPNSSAPC